MREEYIAIVDSGLILQLDDPAIAESWDRINPAPSREDCRRFARQRVEALNWAVRGLVHAGTYWFEAASVRHEHEWKVWRDVKLPAGKVIAPGVVSHSTSVVEHPELVADRITRFADAVGRETVIASTDCGLGGRVHPQIARAELDTLVKGAELATRQLWN